MKWPIRAGFRIWVFRWETRDLNLRPRNLVCRRLDAPRGSVRTKRRVFDHRRAMYQWLEAFHSMKVKASLPSYNQFVGRPSFWPVPRARGRPVEATCSASVAGPRA